MENLLYRIYYLSKTLLNKRALQRMCLASDFAIYIRTLLFGTFHELSPFFVTLICKPSLKALLISRALSSLFLFFRVKKTVEAG